MQRQHLALHSSSRKLVPFEGAQRKAVKLEEDTGPRDVRDVIFNI